MISSYAFAAEDVSEPSGEGVKSESLPPIKKHRISGEEYRKDKTFYLSGQPIGLTVGGSLDTVSGGTFGYYLNPNLILSLDASITYSPEASDYGYHDTIFTIGPHIKFFYVSNFYLKVGFVYRNIESKHHDYSSYPYEVTKVSESGFDVAFGNQWQIYKVTLGLDWVTELFPVTKNVTTTSYSNDDLSLANFEFAKFYIGLSF